MPIEAILGSLVALFFVIYGLIGIFRPSVLTTANAALFAAFGLDNHAKRARATNQIVQARIGGVICLSLGIYLVVLLVSEYS